MTMDDKALARLHEAVMAILRAHGGAMTEYGLITALGERDGLLPASEAVFSTPLTMFQTHFLLFHCLYRLRSTLRRERSGDLSIHCLGIELRPFLMASGDLERYDPLQEYYLDLNQLSSTTEDDVTALLQSFWRRFIPPHAHMGALQVLGLEEGADEAEINARYRRLAMQHHPDRGGDQARFQQISEAVRVLRSR